MDFNIRGKNIEITPAIRTYIERKVGKIERYFHEELNVPVYTNVRTYPGGQTKIEITIPMKHLTLRAEETNPDLYAGIDLATDKIERQIRKHKTKINRKSRVKKEAFTYEADPSFDLEQDGEDTLEIVRTKQFHLKPMDAEEAILQMNLLGHDFFIFIDADTKKTHAVYKRADGKYGLIESLE